MKIRKVLLDGFKGIDSAATLGKLNLITGPVGSGKSAILDGIRFGALGFVPAVGRSPAASGRFLAGTSAQVTLLLGEAGEGSDEAARSLSRTGRGLTAGATATWVPPDATATAAGEAIRARFGASDDEAAQNLDIRGLLAATPNARAAAIDQMLSGRGIDSAVAARWVRALAILRLAEVGGHLIPAEIGDAEAAAGGAEALLARPVRAAVARVVDVYCARVVSSGLPAALETVRADKREAATDVRAKVAARGELETRMMALSAPPASAADLRARRDIAAAALARAIRDLELAAKARETRETTLRVLPALREALEGAQAILAEAIDRAADAPVARAKAAELGDLPPAPERPADVVPDPKALEWAAAQDAQAEEDECAAARYVAEVPTIRGTETQEHALALARSRLAAAATDPWVRVLEVAEAIERAGADDAYGETPLHDWSAALRSAASLAGGESLSDLATAIESAERALEIAEGERLAAIARGDALRADAKAAREMAASYRKAAEDARREAVGAARIANREAARAYDQAMAAWRIEVETINGRRTELIATAEGLERRARAAQEAVDRSRADLTAAEARVAGQDDVRIDETAAESERAKWAAEVAEIDRGLPLAEEADARRREMAALVEEIDAKTALSDVLAAVEWAILRTRERDLAERTGAIEERMRRFLRGAGREEEPYLRLDKGACDFGWIRRGAAIPVEALSGGETVLFMAALAAAVIAIRAPEIRALLIEAAELGIGETAASIMAGCEAVADSLDTVVVATCLPIDARDGWNLIGVGDEE